MKWFDIITVFTLVLALIYKGDAKLKIHIRTTFYVEEAIDGSCVGHKIHFNNHIPVYMTMILDDGCTMKHELDPILVENHYQKNFTITCTNGTHTIECCSNSEHHESNKKIKLEVLKKPKIINKPCNITTAVGLPITFRCYVEGDPNHYWVGWLSRNAIIQQGEKYSVSTSPSFKSTNGTTHYLTVHSVKEAGKYECKVYSLGGDAEDFITHEVHISDDTAQLTSESSSGVSSFLKNFFGTN